ncbi:hypothetical protein GCM10010168_38280 [Actinoplanes ianthinogenes]|uniref:PH domain-containing protein n=1 Tax=Actinoplanes ianthinogenes TaxID=122358 RepID=A0ABM7M4U3_9ACTN|nr:hypothetical protein Aiant_73060 [Actinoplanes ianthinogenes]GGR16659.1 hypothetical protein GCM10010168_38280 [Actinoplanes ianthinogenes]
MIVLVAAAVTALVVGAVELGAPPEPAAAVLLVIGVGALVPAVAILGATMRPGQQLPAFVLDERERTLHTPRTGTFPLLNVAMLAMLGVVPVVPDTETDILPVMWTVGAVAGAFLILCARVTLRGMGLTLTADGLRADKFFGTVTADWDAVDPRQIWTGPFEVRLRYRTPDLVRTTGWVVNPNRLRVDGVAPAFAAATIQHYAATEDERFLIGIPAGTLHPRSHAVSPPRTAEPWNRSSVIPVLVLAVLIGGGAIAGDRWVGTACGNTSVAGFAAHAVTIVVVLFAVRMIRGSVLLLRRRG